MTNLLENFYKPDILSCLSDLSNDEIFTPPNIANNILDLLPKEIWSDPNIKILDPAVKTGVFLREAAKRFIEGEKDIFPNLQERIDHIMHKQLYGIALTELTALISRRSLYCSKYPNGPYSISYFNNPEGNIRFKRINHSWENGKCKYCSAPKKQYDRNSELETYAYEFIHKIKPEEIFEMKFDVIISNPPYQLTDGGAQASAKPIYNHFIEQAMKLNPRFITMIIPSRWYAGGKGLDDFRNKMLSDPHIKELHDFPNPEDCFPGVNIRGGVCYFLWSRDYDNSKDLVKVVTHEKEKTNSMQRALKYKDLDIFLRYGDSLTILNKIMTACNGNVMSKYVSSRKPFGLGTEFAKTQNFKNDSVGMNNPVPCYAKGKRIGYVEYNDIPNHQNWIGKWKLFTSRANNIGTELNDDNLNTFIGKNEICTETYIVIGADMNLTEETASNLANYLQTKFARFCHSLAKASQDATSKTYRFVPVPDISKTWTDQELYAKYKLNTEEIAFIESTIKQMDLNGGEE